MHLEAVEWEVMDWIDLAQDRDRWRDLLKAVMGTFGFHKMQGIYGLAEKRLASQEGLFFVESARG